MPLSDTGRWHGVPWMAHVMNGHRCNVVGGERLTFLLKDLFLGSNLAVCDCGRAR